MLHLLNPLMAVADTDLNIVEVLAEAEPLATQVQEDLNKLKPNVLKQTVQGWVPPLLSFGYRFLLAILIMIIGFRFIRLIKAALVRSFQKMGLDTSVSKLVTNAIDAFLYAMVVFIAAEEIGIPSASILALIGSAGLAVGLSLQGSLTNVAGGILILLTRPFVHGDFIAEGDLQGTVVNIGLIYTTILTIDNRRITIPNGSLSNTTVINMSAEAKRRVDITVGISYSADIRKAKEVMEAVYRSNPLVLADDGITVYVSSLDDSAVTIGGRGWVKTEDYWTVFWGVQEAVKLAYDEAGIEIPFNQVDVHIREN